MTQDPLNTTMGTRRLLIRLLLVAALLLVIVSPFAGPLHPLVRTWFAPALLDLRHCWLRWLSGKCDEEMLWGVRVLWWGRVGKLLSAAGILGAICELAGWPRIQNSGQRMQGWVEKRIPPLATGIRNWGRRLAFAGIAAVLFLSLWLFVILNLERLGNFVNRLPSILPLVAVFILVIVVFSAFWLWIQQLFEVPRLTLVFAWYAVPMAIALLLQFVGSAMAYPKLRWTLGVITAVLLIVGLHFNLLAS